MGSRDPEHAGRQRTPGRHGRGDDPAVDQPKGNVKSDRRHALGDNQGPCQDGEPSPNRPTTTLLPPISPTQPNAPLSWDRRSDEPFRRTFDAFRHLEARLRPRFENKVDLFEAPHRSSPEAKQVQGNRGSYPGCYAVGPREGPRGDASRRRPDVAPGLLRHEAHVGDASRRRPEVVTGLLRRRAPRRAARRRKSGATVGRARVATP